MKKLRHLLQTPANVVELDLLRRGRRLQLSKPLPADDYYAFVSRGDRRPSCDVYHWSVRDPLPTLPIPLRPTEPDILIELDKPFRVAFTRGQYGRFIDYSKAPPRPAMSAEDSEWMTGVLKAAETAGRD